MRVAFFVSSLGDTDLAKATIEQLIQNNSVNSIFLIPLTEVAMNRTQDFSEKEKVKRRSLSDFVQSEKILINTELTKEALEEINQFIDKNKIQRAYVGVPSPVDEEIPYQIARSLEIPCTVAYEFMFKPKNHGFWKHVSELASKENVNFAVPLKLAAEDIFKEAPAAVVNEIGHLSIDRALANPIINTASIDSIKKSLDVDGNDALAFISGTTQPVEETDNPFLEALLQELSTKKYPNLQLRWGLHPGIKDLDAYLSKLLETCRKYPEANSQFKIILPDELAKKLKTVPGDSFILHCNVSGPEAASAAYLVAQAVPGASLNESALKGKASYFYDQTVSSYLPKTWFSDSISTFFNSKSSSARSRKDLGLNDNTAPQRLAELMLR